MVRGLIACGVAALLLALPIGGVYGAGHPAGRHSSGRIVYVGNDGNLYLIAPDGTGRRALTTDATQPTAYVAPTWSPSGQGILALRFARGLGAANAATAGLWLVSPSGGARQLLTSVPRGFAWAPDGHSVVYETGYYPDRTALTTLDTRSGQTHTVYCDTTFTLTGVTPVGNRAVGVQGGQIETVSLSDGTAQALTHYAPKAGVLQNVMALSRSGGTLLYSVGDGTQVISLDLRTNHSTTTSAGGALRGVAPSPDLRWIAYTTTGAANTAESMLLRAGKSAAPLRGDSFITPQAFAPDSSALTYTSLLDGPGYIFVAPTGCPDRCARRLGLGHDAVWGP